MRIKSMFLIADCGCNPKGFSSCRGPDGHCECSQGYAGPKCYGCLENYYKTPNNLCEGIVYSL